MSNNNYSNSQQHMAPGESIAIVLIVMFLFGLGFVWSSAELAMWLFHGHFFHATGAATASAVIHFPKHLSNPAAAWPAPFSAELPDAKQYWSAIALELVGPVILVVGVVVAVHRVRSGARDSRRSSLDRRKRAGVVAEARFAKSHELSPLFARLPLHGRFLLGKVGWHYLATEPSWTERRRGRSTGPGSRSSVRRAAARR
jgi:uncharacterized membrane protein YphA (DoxX/SURF4 family)